MILILKYRNYSINHNMDEATPLYLIYNKMSANQEQTSVEEITADINDISIENKRSRLSKLTNHRLGEALYHTYSITLTK